MNINYPVPFWPSFFAGLPAVMFLLALAIGLIYGGRFLRFLIEKYKEKHLPVITQDTPYD
jgi:hypothetical protein